ncbi:MAG: hypothetical protein Kow0013_14450 [Pararhodobacter sp.]
MNQQPAPPSLARGATFDDGLALPGIEIEHRDGIALLSLAGPDGNRLSPELVASLHRAFLAAQSDPQIQGIVLASGGPDFCAGASLDLPPPGPDDAEPPAVLSAFAALCDAIASGSKPTACALRGRVSSGGLALALAAQARIAGTRTVFDLPEPRLGRLPPGNATVRLGWLIGARAALPLLTGRAPLDAAAALDAGLIDTIEPGTQTEAAIARARGLAASWPRQPAFPGLADARDYRAAITEARAALEHPLPEHRKALAMMLDTLEAAQLLPPAQALAFDLVRAEDVACTPTARALTHLARATRRALDIPERQAGAQPRSGPVLAALSPPLAARLLPTVLRAGETVILTDPGRDALAETLEAVANAQLDLVRQGKMTQAQADEDWARVSGLLDIAECGAACALSDVEHASWLSETAPRDTPRLLWGRAVTAACGPAAGLVPAPDPGPRLCEILVTPDTAPEATRQATRFALALRLTPIRVQGAPVLPRLTEALAGAAARLRGLGVGAETLTATGLLPRGLSAVQAADPPADLPLPVDRLLLLATINAGLRLLESGACLRPSDLDLAMVLGAGWPNWRGGPMAEGDRLGPLVLRHELRLATPLDPALWHPEPMLDEMIRHGWRFEDLNTG